jgi:hypothetical protein
MISRNHNALHISLRLSAAASLHGQLHIIRWERLPPANKQTPADEHAKASKETELLFRSLNFDSNLRFTHHILTTLAKLNTSLRLQLFTRHIPAIHQSHHLCGPMQKIPLFIRRILISFVKLNTCKFLLFTWFFFTKFVKLKNARNHSSIYMRDSTYGVLLHECKKGLLL